MTEIAPTVQLNNGYEMPRLGLGTWPMNDEEATRDVAQAIGIGYRLLDTAENYENERGVGAAVRAGGVDRSEVFVTTKFNRKWHSVDGVRQACEASLERLGLDYIDLYLVHWPNPDQGTYVEAVEGLLAVQQAGLVRSIGTSNFLPEHLDKVFAQGYTVQVNQVQLDPYHTRQDVVEYNTAHNLVTESWSPIGRAGALLTDPAVLAAAEAHGRNPGQIVLRWHVQQGLVPLPKSSDPTRQAQNLDVFSFELTEAEMASLNLDRPDPDMMDSNVFGH